MVHVDWDLLPIHGGKTIGMYNPLNIYIIFLEWMDDWGEKA